MTIITTFLFHTLFIVDINSLVCENQEQPDTDSTEVCATNGVTYPSLCRLIQDTGNEAVAYAGQCDSEDCEGGQVNYQTLHCDSES